MAVDKARNDGFFVEEANNETVSDLLMKGFIIGRCDGRMEFGARALGNRSILASPEKRSSVRAINEKIKNRDFWMPFAPSLIEEYAHRYIENPKKIRSPFMSIGFRSTNEAKMRLGAVTHPADKTLRPNLVSRAMNAKYYDLIHAFYKKSGLGALLNTSFNLHGKPIVNTAADAYQVFLKTDLDAVILGDKLVSRKKPNK